MCAGRRRSLMAVWLWASVSPPTRAAYTHRQALRRYTRRRLCILIGSLCTQHTTMSILIVVCCVYPLCCACEGNVYTHRRLVCTVCILIGFAGYTQMTTVVVSLCILIVIVVCCVYPLCCTCVGNVYTHQQAVYTSWCAGYTLPA